MVLDRILVPMYPSKACGFMLVINGLLTYIVSHRFHVIADYWSTLRFRQGSTPFDTLPRKSGLRTGEIVLSCDAKSVSIS